MFKPKKFDEAFLDGYKPALLEANTRPCYEHLKYYPHMPYTSYAKNNYIFFQTEEQLDTYRKQIEGVKEYSPEFHRIVGLAMGFPRRSVEFFVKLCETEEGAEKEVVVSWAGFQFSTGIDFADQEVKWLWDTYKHPKAIGNPAYFWNEPRNHIVVPYGDLDGVKRVQNMLLNNIKTGKIAVRSS